MKTKRLVMIGLACTAMIVAAAPARSGGLEYSLTPYLWATGLDGSVGLGTIAADLDVGFSDLLDDLEIAVPIHFEARGPVFSLIAEVNFVGLEQDLEALGGTSDIDMLMFEFLSGWQFRENFELIFGARYTDLDVELNFEESPTGGDRTRFDEGQDWVDPIVGIRYAGQLNRRGTWHSSFRVDVGGFGLGSDLVVNVRTILGVDLSHATTLWFGYHWLDTDYDDNGFLYDMLQQGPEIAVQFKF